MKIQESLYIPIKCADGTTQDIHLKRLCKDSDGAVVVLFHGVIENGTVFYKGDDKGLGNYLADRGFLVYVVDFRGRGLSRPKIDKHSQFGQHESIVEDIPSVIEYLQKRHQEPLHVICHSWGGVLFSSAYIRNRGFEGRIRSLTCFGTKRRVQARTFDRFVKVSVVWNRLVPILAKRDGFFDAKRYGIGDDSESRQFVQDSIDWIRSKHWRDSKDNLDYQGKACEISWPPTWYFSAKKDYSLGYKEDVQRFIDECQIQDCRHTFLSKASGHLLDYDHVNMLTHPLAREDHFPALADWLHQLSRP